MKLTKRDATDSCWGDWRWQLAHSLSGPGDARALLGASALPLVPNACRRVVERYPFRVTPYYLALADGDDPQDPVLKQCLPDPRELEPREGTPDPFDEQAQMPVPGLVHRFPDRALVLATGACAVRCRHCTRKNTLGAFGTAPSRAYFDAILAAIRRRPGIREVLVSGGDPLLLEEGLLDWLLVSLRAIGHVRVLRIGTRVPVVLPMRVDEALADRLARHRPLWVNTQFNHPVEVTPEAVLACERLLCRGIPVSNQAVLMRGINDSVDVLRALCNALQEKMIRPYYVFQCDPVAGTRHVAVDPARGAAIAEELRKTVGGLSLPRFVADVPGEQGKLPLERLT